MKKEESRSRAEQNILRIKRLRVDGIQDLNYRNWTFEQDDGRNPTMTEKAKRYVSSWDKVYHENIGLLCWGDTDTGKSFFAAEIANALIDKGTPVLMTNLIRLINSMGGVYDSGRNEYIDSLNNYRLLILDDLGAERQTDTMLEQVYNVIDSRANSGLPVIFTTNLGIKEIEHPADMKYKRLYSRILGMCVPIQFTGPNRRTEAGAQKLKQAKAFLK